MNPSGRVCARCARIKQRCDGNEPCSRCKRLGHDCKPRSPSAKETVDLSLPVAALRRPRASRSRGGCLSCKARKKKCDETRPRCSDCRRLNLPCQWLADTRRLSRDRAASSESSESSESHATASPEDPIESSDGHPQVLGSITPDDDDEFIATLFPHPLPEQNAVILPLDRSPISTNPFLRSNEDRSLFNHYIHVVARALSRSHDPDRNPFLVTLLPLAAASDAVTSIILSLSGCHWRRVYPSIWGCALKHQGQALAHVNTLLGRSDPQCIFEACATVLLLCLTELFDGTSKVWKWHLKAASAILKSPAFQSLISNDQWTFCISLFHYLDSMSTISRCKAPLLHNGDTMAEITTSFRRNSMPELGRNQSTDAIYGISPALLDYLGMVNLLANHRSKRIDELSEIGFRAAATQLECRINEWRVDHDQVAEQEPDTERATTAFEWAIRLRLHQVVEGYDPLHKFVEQAITAILDAVQKVPYASRVEGCLLFPLVIAGSSSVSIERRMMVKERLMVMENTLGFGHIQYARQLLETVWDGCASDFNWAAVRYNKFPGVVFI
ncbi:hypothetical protein N7462_004236 [Penicillium macrosclerotiorum]|uniref:uncharacterized protein n=1 Tax=Penicillium macrosclerotiorum TaxID=303699 RepID=UPI0025491865|nr:uncharacterized protein N7462_004236 [Penicillium macrosclerotiorum]KAJ5689844.1 hypothetical protein N7462_004236 [Penicillium macrosclerotiorum]